MCRKAFLIQKTELRLTILKKNETLSYFLMYFVYF